LIQFDKDFYDNNDLQPKTLNRFLIDDKFKWKSIDTDRDDCIRLLEKPILINSPSNCDCLQYHITFILNEICIEFINGLRGYETLWKIMCQQLEFGSLKLKIVINKTY
jgi:hypothetical protein